MAKRRTTRQNPRATKRVKTTKKKTTINKSLSNKMEKALLFITNPRVREIIERRFGLRDGKPETLESIGQSHDITRERVRQIQDVGLKVLKSDEVLSLFVPIFQYLDNLFSEHGNLMGEEHLYSLATNTDGFHPLRGHLYLVLTLGKPYQKIINDSRFHPYWTADISARDRAEKVVDFLINHLNKEKRVFHEPDLLDILSRKHSNLPSQMFNVVLDIAKEIDKNNFGEIGLVHWPEITPQGVKDRAYLVLRKKGEPLHFREIASLINEMGLSSRPAYPQTVHNELIKDPRFVLVGRGTYAPKEWGYEPGTVSDVIKKILKEKKKPMTKKEIVDAVLTQRRVKPTTVVLNLQRSPNIVRLRNDKYTLKV